MRKSGGGHPKSAIWVFFDERPGKGNKSRRKGAACKHCSKNFPDARPELLTKHITLECARVTAEQRALAFEQVGKTRVGGTSSTSAAKPILPCKRTAMDQPVAARQHEAGPLSAATVKELDTKMLLMFLMCGIPFTAARNPFFLAFVKALRPQYHPPGATKLKTTLLTQEYAQVQNYFMLKLKNEGSVTLRAVLPGDGLIRGTSSMYGCDAVTADRSAHLLKMFEPGEEPNSAEHLAEVLKECVDQLGPTRVAAVVANNTPTMRAACKLLTEMEGCRHILDVRCFVSAFSGWVGSAMSHPWAREIISKAHSLVEFLKASQHHLSLLSSAAASTGCKVVLAVPSLSQITSLRKCLAGLLGLRPALMALAGPQEDGSGSTVLDYLGSQEFWSGLEILCQLLSPYEEVVEAVQANSAAMAELMRKWLHLARAIKGQLSAIPDESFKQHLVACFNTRWSQLSCTLARLALFLDPRYKEAADANGAFRELIVEAVEVMARRGYGPSHCQNLITQLQLYKANMPPYDMASGGEGFNVKAWWLALASESTKDLVNLAVLLQDITCYAAATRRPISSHNTTQSDKRNRLDPYRTSMMNAIKLHYLGHVPQIPIDPATDGEAGLSSADCSTADEDEEEVEAQVEEFSAALESIYSMDQQEMEAAAGGAPLPSPGITLHGFDMGHPTLAPGYTPGLTTPSAPLLGLGDFSGGRFDIHQFLDQQLGPDSAPTGMTPLEAAGSPFPTNSESQLLAHASYAVPLIPRNDEQQPSGLPLTSAMEDAPPIQTMYASSPPAPAPSQTQPYMGLPSSSWDTEQSQAWIPHCQQMLLLPEHMQAAMQSLMRQRQ